MKRYFGRMGGWGSRLVRRSAEYLFGWEQKALPTGEPGSPAWGRASPGPGTSAMATPFVFRRRSSLFVDLDGDVAHEFYEETHYVCNGQKRAGMRRIFDDLTPQGIVELEFPRLHVDMPFVLCDSLSFSTVR
ncbi:tumor suppressor candidate 2-like [Branchiostoma lanceolatum]|uniref:tumor suppressor candidate 2-like n=1 Tax=Branchiostoma lanceolatum TaxID=7740 RepID=UPI001132B12B